MKTDLSMPPQQPMTDPRHLAGPALADALRDSRAQTWARVEDLTDAQWLPAYRAGVNPIAWELGHLAWFAEYWVLRAPHQRDAAGFAISPTAPRFAGPDAHFDSARLAHGRRWEIALPSRAELREIMQAQLEACLHALPGSLYHQRLALFHEDMHAEAFCWLRANLGYSAPVGVLPPQIHPQGSLDLPGGSILMGYPENTAPAPTGFAFDNEIGVQAHTLPAFSIDTAPVSVDAFSQFVDAGGYDQAEFWPGEAGAWRAGSALSHPATWRKTAAGTWQHRWFDNYLPLEPLRPVIHINAYEAEAYCRWAKRRLPRAAEWEYAALQSAALQSSCFHWGNAVWEWTSDPFLPYSGFTPGPYREYSAPWFGNHRELRGGAFATHARMHHPRYRNFFMPQRSDIFAGFRTVAL